jgi:hypothetical protein
LYPLERLRVTLWAMDAPINRWPILNQYVLVGILTTMPDLVPFVLKS